MVLSLLFKDFSSTRRFYETLMQDEIIDDQPITLEKRTSYFDIVKANVGDKNSMNYLSIIVGQFFKEVDRSEYAAHYQRMFRNQQTESDRITGILLCYRNTFVHVLEAPKRIMDLYLQDVAKSNEIVAEFGSPLTESTRLLLLLDDHPTRYFPFWASRILDIKDDQQPLDMAQMDPKSIDDLVTVTCELILKVGLHLTSLSKV